MKNQNMGKFVTENHVEFTNIEAMEIVENLKAQFAKYGDFGIRYSSYEIVKDNILPYLIIFFECPHYKGRDSENARFELFGGIEFHLYKETGRIEIDWKNNQYEPFDGFCYSGNIRFKASWCAYKHKHFESYQKVCPFSYGDELSDLNYEESIKQLYKDLMNCKIIK